MMYRAVTGKLPVDSLRRLRSDPLVPAVQAANGRYSKALLRAIDQMIRIDERERPATVADIKALLSPLSPLFAARARPEKAPVDTKQPIEARASTRLARNAGTSAGASTASPRRTRLWIGVGGLALILIIGAAAIHFRGSTPQSKGNGTSAGTGASETLTPPDQSKRPSTDVDGQHPADTAETIRPGKDAKDTPVDFTPGHFFRDCPSCPEMAVLPTGHFEMGSNDGFPNEAPAHDELIPAPFRDRA